MEETARRAALVAAPVELTLGDKTYVMSPLTDRDYSELDQYVQSRYIEAALRAAESFKSREMWDRVMTLAMQTAVGLSWSASPGVRVWGTLDGITRLIWQGVKRNMPEVTHEELRPLLVDQRNVEKANEFFKRVNRVPKATADDTPDPGGDKSFRKRKRTRR